MAEVRAFRGVRYRGDQAERLGQVLAPPYDAASPELMARLHALSPYNMVHVEYARPANGADPHAQAAARFRSWLGDGFLASDPAPALYAYDHEFDHHGRRRVRRGLFAAVRLAAWEERIVLPHEGTFPGPRLERQDRLRAVQANLSPLYLLYQDPARELRAMLEAMCDRPPVATATDPTGDSHRLWLSDDPNQIDAIADFFVARRLYVADGHHRYEAALAYRDECRAAAGPARDPDASHEFVLALLADLDDPGVLVLPTHRLLRDLPDFAADRIRARLLPLFDLERSVAERNGPSLPTGDPTVVCALHFAGEEERWLLRTKAGDPHAAFLPAGRSAAWRRLDVAILAHVVIEAVLGLRPDRLADHLSFTPDAAVARQAVADRSAQLACLVKPPSLHDLVVVADSGEKMPPKSTYFRPKVPAGLVIHDLDGE